MYEDPIPHFSSQNHQHHVNPSNHDQQQQQHQQQNLNPDHELQRLHQHQLLIQLRLEVNSLRTQIQQLELLKQQLIHQRQMMHPGEYEQLMDQFSRTTASLLRVGHPSHFAEGNGSQQPTIERGFKNGSLGGGEGGAGGSGGVGGGGGYAGMHMMERLQEKLKSMTLQQQHQQQQESAQRQQQRCQSSSSEEMHMDSEGMHSGASSPRKDPVRMEHINLEAELRDLEKRMRSIQLLQ